MGEGSLDRMREESASLSRFREARTWREEVMELRVWARRASEGFEDMAGREKFGGEGWELEREGQGRLSFQVSGAREGKPAAVRRVTFAPKCI